MILPILLGLGVLSVASGCDALLGGELNPEYCKAHPSDAQCKAKFPDAGADGAKACLASTECAPLVCDVDGTKTCVQCTSAEPAACTGTTPACVNTQCMACTSHTQCATNACLPDGSCADEARVAYVDPSGTDNASCTRSTPCTKVAKALATNRAYVKLSGTTNEQVSLNNRNVTFLAAPGAKLSDTSNGILLRVDGSSQVEIYDLEIGGASGAGNPGISLQPGNTATLKLVRSKVSGNAGAGISAFGGTLTVSQSTVSMNQAAGISASGGMLTVSQSTVSMNQAAGISAAGGALTVSQSTVSTNNDTGVTMSAPGVVVVTNNFIQHNGNTITASAGGLLLKPMGASKVEFNTVIDNQASLGSLSAGGISCDVPGFVSPHNIVFRNTGGTAGTVQTIGTCTYQDSYNMPAVSASDNTPQFKSPNAQPFDYHLTSGSPASIVGAAGACTGVDFDGEARPQGGACDLGADELKP